MNRSSEIIGRLSSRDTMSPAFLGALSEEGFNGNVKTEKTASGLHYENACGQQDQDLKALLLVNLDLIQNQQEVLLANERTINALKRENEMLKCRLDRIERRMSLVYQKGANQFSSVLPASASGSLHPKSENRPTRLSNRKLSLEPADLSRDLSDAATEADVHLKQDLETQNAEKDHKSEETRRKSVHSKGHSFSTSSRKTASKIPTSRSKAGRGHEVPGSGPEKAARQSDASSFEKRDRKCDRMLRRVRRNSELLTTDALYYVPPLLADDDELEEEEEESTSSNQEQIPVPSWRIKSLSSLYVMEGTENLDDRVFLKRHQKSEAEEKRRKRWDIQRLKDMQLLARQRAYVDARANAKPDIVTFLPQIDKALFIDVDDVIPVSAFGHSIPRIDSQEFSLPWYNASKDKSNKNKRLRKT